MRGAQHLIDLRLDGFEPQLVFVDTDGPSVADHPWFADQPTVFIEPSDRLARLDLRCFLGLALSVTGADEERVEAVKAAALKAGAARVIACVFEGREVVKHTDTREGYEWHRS